MLNPWKRARELDEELDDVYEELKRHEDAEETLLVAARMRDETDRALRNVRATQEAVETTRVAVEIRERKMGEAVTAVRQQNYELRLCLEQTLRRVTTEADTKRIMGLLAQSVPTEEVTT